MIAPEQERMMQADPIDAVLDDLRNGTPVMLVSADEKCIVAPAQFVTPSLMAGPHGPGAANASLALTTERAQQLGISAAGERADAEPGAAPDTAPPEADSAIAVARSRARAIAAAVSPTATGDDIGRDGLVAPVVVREGGVLVRPDLAEAAVDLVQLAGLMPAAAFWPAPGLAGTSPAPPTLRIATIASLIAYRRENERLVECIVEAPFDCYHGQDFRIRVYRDTVDGAEHVALLRGQPGPEDTVMVRIHQLDLTADLLQFKAAHPDYVAHAIHQLARYSGAAVGVFLQDSDPCSASSLITGGRRAYAERKRDRDYGIAGQILQDLGISRVALLTSSQRKVDAVEGFGLEVVERIAMAR